MKILVLASWYPKNDSDPFGRFIQDQAKLLSKKFEVKVLDCSHSTALLPRKVLDFALSKKVLKACKSFKPNLIHAHVSYPAGVLALIAKEKLGIPVVLTEHTGPLDLLVPYYDSQESFYAHFKRYDKIIAVSRFLKEEICKYDHSLPVSIVGNLVRDEFLSAPLRLDASQTEFTFIGALHESKGIPEFLDALDEYEKLDGPAIHVHLLGRGKLQSEIEKRRESWKLARITIHSQNQTSVFDLFQKSSTLLLPSRYETFSLVAAEALALGRAVLGFNPGGPRDFVTKECGVLLPERSPELLAQEILKFATDPQWKLTLEEANKRRSWIQQNFSAEAILAKLEKELLSVTQP